MMTPGLAEQYLTQDSLRDAPLLRTSKTDFLSAPLTWATWFQAQGMAAPEMHGPVFSQVDHGIEAALSGVGILLGRVSLTAGLLRTGSLVAPFATALSSPAATRFVCRQGMERSAPIADFLGRIRAEIADTSDLSRGRQILSASAGA